LPALKDGLKAQGLRLEDVRWVLLTHIHLDHAGAAGSLVKGGSDLEVYVHERGAPHLRDPGRLLASAEQLYGNQMGELWGDVLPVPQKNLFPLGGGEQVEVGGRRFEVMYTPGHAMHHVSYLDRESGVAFVGDTAGVCLQGGYVLPPTPPPDIDLNLWNESIRLILQWAPDSLFLTHFGIVQTPRRHLRALQENLGKASTFVRELLDDDIEDEVRRAQFVDWIEREILRDGPDAKIYGAALPIALSWYGLERYWKKRRQ
jgi:glyoxylase-like metal-dependent hydrolase (beta-lactamase superfamily II)